MVKALTVIYTAASHCEALTEGSLGQARLIYARRVIQKCTGGINACLQACVWLARPPRTGRGNGIQAETIDASLDGKYTTEARPSRRHSSEKYDQIYWSATNEPVSRFIGKTSQSKPPGLFVIVINDCLST